MLWLVVEVVYNRNVVAGGEVVYNRNVVAGGEVH
jgi:hypothetical protein